MSDPYDETACCPGPLMEGSGSEAVRELHMSGERLETWFERFSISLVVRGPDKYKSYNRNVHWRRGG